MSRSDLSHPLPASPSPVAVPVSPAASVHPREAESSLQVAVPASGTAPSFDNVYALAVTGALLDQSVVVICLTEESLMDWRRRLQARVRPLDGLTLVDGRFGWSANWRAFFQHKPHDITVVHGIHVALKEQNIPISYAKRLVDSIPSGLIVLA